MDPSLRKDDWAWAPGRTWAWRSGVQTRSAA